MLKNILIPVLVIILLISLFLYVFEIERQVSISLIVLVYLTCTILIYIWSFKENKRTGNIIGRGWLVLFGSISLLLFIIKILMDAFDIEQPYDQILFYLSISFFIGGVIILFINGIRSGWTRDIRPKLDMVLLISPALFLSLILQPSVRTYLLPEDYYSLENEITQLAKTNHILNTKFHSLTQKDSAISNFLELLQSSREQIIIASGGYKYPQDKAVLFDGSDKKRTAEVLNYYKLDRKLIKQMKDIQLKFPEMELIEDWEKKFKAKLDKETTVIEMVMFFENTTNRILSLYLADPSKY